PTDTGTKAKPSKNPADRQKTQQDPSSSPDTLEPPTQPRNHTKIGQRREDQREQSGVRLQPHSGGYGDTRLARRELSKLLGPDKRALRRFRRFLSPLSTLLIPRPARDSAYDLRRVPKRPPRRGQSRRLQPLPMRTVPRKRESPLENTTINRHGRTSVPR